MFSSCFCRKGRKWKGGEKVKKKLEKWLGRSDLAKSLAGSWSRNLGLTCRNDLDKRFGQINCPNQTNADKDSSRGKRKNQNFKSVGVLSYFKHHKTNPMTSPRATPKEDFPKEVLFMIKYKDKEGIKNYKRPSQIRILNPNWIRTPHL